MSDNGDPSPSWDSQPKSASKLLQTPPDWQAADDQHSNRCQSLCVLSEQAFESIGTNKNNPEFSVRVIDLIFRHAEEDVLDSSLNIEVGL